MAVAVSYDMAPSRVFVDVTPLRFTKIQVAVRCLRYPPKVGAEALY